MDTFMDQLSQKLTAQEIIRANGEAESEQMVVMREQVKEYEHALERMKTVADELSGLQSGLNGLQNGLNGITSGLSSQIAALADSRMNSEGQTAGLSEEAIGTLRTQMEEITKSSEEQMERIRRSTAEGLANFRKSSEEQFESIRRDNDEAFANINRGNAEQIAGLQKVSEDLERLGTQIGSLSEQQGGGVSDEVVAGLRSQIEQMLQANNEQLSGLQKELMENLGSGDDFHKECVRIYRNVQAVVQEESGKLSQNTRESISPIEEQIKALKGKVTMAIAFSAVGAVAAILAVVMNFL